MNILEHDNPPRAYADERLACKTLADLKAVVERWKPLVLDAWQRVQSMTEDDFNDYQRGVTLESQGIYGGDEWYESFKDICFPAVMFQVSMWATEFGTPWGHVFERCREQGIITTDEEGVCQLVTV